MTGCIFDIQPFSTHDGPGIRTVIFFKGCPLRCRWCHNPEGLSTLPQLAYQQSRCIACGVCVTSCAAQCHQLQADGAHTLDRTRCQGCGACVRVCPTGALELVGEQMTVAQVMARVLIDQPFFQESGGGITLSGGEPLQQPEFAAALLRTAHEAGIGSYIETSGQAPWSAFAAVLPYTEGFLYDVKELDCARHQQYTGIGNSLILANLRRLYDAGAKITLRLPIIPGYNERPEHFQAVEKLVESLPGLAGVERIPYHPLGRGKLARFGLIE